MPRGHAGAGPEARALKAHTAASAHPGPPHVVVLAIAPCGCTRSCLLLPDAWWAVVGLSSPRQSALSRARGRWACQ